MRCLRCSSHKDIEALEDELTSASGLGAWRKRREMRSKLGYLKSKLLALEELKVVLMKNKNSNPLGSHAWLEAMIHWNVDRVENPGEEELTRFETRCRRVHEREGGYREEEHDESPPLYEVNGEKGKEVDKKDFDNKGREDEGDSEQKEAEDPLPQYEP